MPTSTIKQRRAGKTDCKPYFNPDPVYGEDGTQEVQTNCNPTTTDQKDDDDDGDDGDDDDDDDDVKQPTPSPSSSLDGDWTVTTKVTRSKNGVIQYTVGSNEIGKADEDYDSASKRAQEFLDKHIAKFKATTK
eukprot:Pgem_evm1s12658